MTLKPLLLSSRTANLRQSVEPRRSFQDSGDGIGRRLASQGNGEARAVDLVLVGACALGIGHRTSLSGQVRQQAEADRALRSSSLAGVSPHQVIIARDLVSPV